MKVLPTYQGPKGHSKNTRLWFMNKPGEITTLTEISHLPKIIIKNKEVMSPGPTLPWCTVSNQDLEKSEPSDWTPKGV